MWYYIRHYFNPDFDYLHLKPIADSKGIVDLRNLNYVQNVVKGQVLAEILPLEDDISPLPEKRFIMPEPLIPAGANTEIDPENPHRLLSSINGYVFLYNKEITVKHLLNVRRNIDLHTGHIAFVGDLVIHGDVTSEFELRASNVIVKGIIEGAFIKTVGSIEGKGGFKGSQKGKLIADNNIRLPFAETGEIRAGGNVAIDGSCMHCTIYAGLSVLVLGRLAGGIIRARHKVYVAHQLGLSSTTPTPTRIVMGQDPFIFRQIKKLEKEQARLQEEMVKLEAIQAIEDEKQGDSPTNKKYLLVKKKLEVLHHKLNGLKPLLYESNTTDCLLVVQGEIMPGVIVTIGDISLKLHKSEKNVQIKRIGDEIVIENIVAAKIQAK